MADGQIFKEAVKAKRLTQVEVAEMLGISRATVNLLMAKSVLSEDWKLKICAALGLDRSVFTSKESTEYGINADPSHVLTAQEREALWKIIDTQKEIIARLERELKDSKE